MAKKSRKKKVTRKKTAVSRAKKKTAKTSTQSKSKSVSRGNKASASRAANNSVDSLLKKFAKDRTQQETQLSGLRKKRDDLENKASKLQEQISGLRQKEKEIETKISGLDQQRDIEVKELLQRLGIKLDGTPANSPSHNQSATERAKHLQGVRDVGSFANGRNN